MREAGTQRSARRVVGRPALVRSLRALLRRAHRFSAQRACGHDEQVWAARFVDGLEAVLRDVDRGAMTMAGATTGVAPGVVQWVGTLDQDGHDA